MCFDLGVCMQCGAKGEIGSKCEYCGSIISAPRTQGNHSMIETYNEYQLDGFSIVDDKVEGNTDFPEFQVIQGNKTGYYGMVDRYGVVRIPCIYDYIKVYLDNNLCAITKDHRNAVYNTDGEVVIPFGEINPLGAFFISDGLIVGYNSVYDLQGNLKIQLPTNKRIVLLSERYATTLQKQGVYSLESCETLLDDSYKVDKIIDTHLIIVNKAFNGFTRYGIYDCKSQAFVLDTEFTSVLQLEYNKYEARSQSEQNDGSTKSRTLILVINDGKIEIEREDIQTYQTGAGIGCMLLLLPLLLPILYFIL